jgi:hypothetical protein
MLSVTSPAIECLGFFGEGVDRRVPIGEVFAVRAHHCESDRGLRQGLWKYTPRLVEVNVNVHKRSSVTASATVEGDAGLTEQAAVVPDES